jgi:hypothetical protein
MASITRAEAQAYFKRWDLVKEIELAELRGTSMHTKLRHLSALMASRSLFGVDPERESGTQLVRDRWARLCVFFAACQSHPMSARAPACAQSSDCLADNWRN